MHVMSDYLLVIELLLGIYAVYAFQSTALYRSVPLAVQFLHNMDPWFREFCESRV